MSSRSVAVLFLCFTGVWCHDCNLTKPYFQSRNFYHVLHWNKVDIPGEVVLYSVEYLTYGEPYRPASRCQNISVPVCDLTSVMMVTDVTSRYHIKITAAGRCVGQLLFYPYQQTTLEAPDVFVSWNETAVNVTVSPPMGPNNRSIQSFSCLGTCQHPMKFTVNLTRPKFAVGRVYESMSGSVLVWPVETDTEYCGDAVYSFTHPSSARHSDRTSFCVTVPARHSWFHMVVFPILLAVIVLIMFPMILCHRSVKRKGLWPKALTLSNNKTLPYCSDSRDEISKVHLHSGFMGNFTKFDLPASVVQEESKVMGSWSGYASQDSRDQESSTRCSSGEQSVNYTMIVGVQEKPSADVQTISKLSSLELVSNPGTSEPLVVPVVPNADGLLQLNGFLFQSDSMTEPLSKGLTLFEERTPLLTDLIIEDLRCNSKYLPADVSQGVHPDLTPVTSSYRQNWMPGTPLEGCEDQRTYVLRTANLQASHKEMKDEEDEESKVSLNFLDRWMIKMES